VLSKIRFPEVYVLFSEFMPLASSAIDNVDHQYTGRDVLADMNV